MAPFRLRRTSAFLRVGASVTYCAQRVLRLAGVIALATCTGDNGPAAPALTTITVSLSSATIIVGQTATAAAAGTDQRGSAISTGVVTWSSSAPGVATVASNGMITAVAPGQTTITGSAGGRMGQAMLTVVRIPVASVTVSPPNASVVVGGALQLSAVTLDASNAALSGRTISWSSSDTTKLRVSNAGLVTALAVGNATVTATSEGKAGVATIAVVSTLVGEFGLDLFALIPAGSFQMGSTVVASSEGPIHTVTITRSFYLQKTEVTQRQWATVMGDYPSLWSGCGDACPVENVSWTNIQTFIQTLNARTPGVTYRLPTEAEWEYAARAGTTGAAYGALDSIAWHAGNSGLHPHAAALKAPNAWGLYDMIGNVYEWVADWYGDYAGLPLVDPTGPATGTRRVLRGGSYADRTSLRAAYRAGTEPVNHGMNMGFRLVRNP